MFEIFEKKKFEKQQQYLDWWVKILMWTFISCPVSIPESSVEDSRPVKKFHKSIRQCGTVIRHLEYMLLFAQHRIYFFLTLHVSLATY